MSRRNIGIIGEVMSSSTPQSGIEKVKGDASTTDRKISRVVVKKQKSITSSSFQPSRRSGSTGSTGSVESNGSNSSNGSGKLRPPPVRRGSHRSSSNNSATRQLAPPSTPQHDFELACKHQANATNNKLDMEMFVAYIQRSAENGYGLAQCALGIIYEYGADVDDGIRQAEMWYELAAQQNVSQAAYNLGCILLNREDSTLNTTQDFTTYAEDPNKSSKSIRYARAVDLLADAAGDSYAEAQVKLGRLITAEKGVSNEVKLLAIKATVHVTESILHRRTSSFLPAVSAPTYLTVESARANDKLMKRLLGIGDDDVALEYSLTVGKLLLRLAYKQGSLSACYELGNLLVSGRFNQTMKRDLKSFGIEVKTSMTDDEFRQLCRKKGRDLWVQAADRGHAESMHALFTLFSIDYGAAVVAAMASLDNESDEFGSEFDLGSSQENSVLLSKEDAFSYLNKAVQFELPVALQDYALIILDGDTLGLGIYKDTHQAIQFLTFAAHNQCGLAQQRLGDIFRDGDVLQKDITAAIEWYTRASLLGLSSARIRLAKLLLELNGPLDMFAAGFHLKAAVEQGNVEAMLELADFELKSGEKEGLPRARELLETAALKGSTEASDRLKAFRESIQSRRASDVGKIDYKLGISRSGSSQLLKSTAQAKKDKVANSAFSDMYELLQEAVKSAEEACKEHTPEVLAEEIDRTRLREERLFLDDNTAREIKRLPEWTSKLKREIDRKAKQLESVYEAALEKKYVKRRKKDRSVRTVEGYNDDWFTHEAQVDDSEVGSPNSSRKSHLLSAGERITAKMGKRIQGKEYSEFAELRFEPGLQVWRADGFHMQYDKKVSRGLLLKGASYIIVHITDDIQGGEEGGGGGGGGLAIHLFHWVGSAAPMDSKAVSSFKCTELARRLRHDMAESLEDDRSSAKTVKMTRESEGEESADFIQAFERYLKQDRAAKSSPGIRYVEGGSSTALSRPPPKHDRPRLFRVTLLTSQVKSPAPQTPKGSGTPKSVGDGEGTGRLDGTPKHKKPQHRTRVEASLCEVERKETSLKAEWVLILDGGKDVIFVFRGFLSTTLHRAKAFEMAFLMRQERIAFIGKCRVVQVDQGDEPDEFWQFMPEVNDMKQLNDQVENIQKEEEEEEEEEEEDDEEEDLVDDTDMFEDNEDAPKSRGRRKSIYLKKISQWELSISLALDQVVDQVVEEMFTSSSERILHSFYRNKTKPPDNEQTFQEVNGQESAEVDVFDYDASFFAEDKSMGLTIKDVLIMMQAREESRVQVVAVDAGSPGDLEGIEPGDILLAINNDHLDNMRRRQVTERIKSAGRPLTITLRRGFPLVDDKVVNTPSTPTQREKGSENVNRRKSGAFSGGEEVDEEDERVRDFTSLLIENGQRPSVSVLNQFRSVIGGGFKPWKKKKSTTSEVASIGEGGLDAKEDDKETPPPPPQDMPMKPKPKSMEQSSKVVDLVDGGGPIVLGAIASDAAFAKYQQVETAIELRPGASVLVQRSSGEWCFGEVLSYDFNTSKLSVRVGPMKKKGLELNKKRHLGQLRVRPGDILLGHAPDSPEASSMRKRPSSDKLAKTSTPKASSQSKSITPRANSRGSTPKNVSRLDGVSASSSAFGFQEEDTLEIDKEFRQRRILYRVGIIGGQYNIAEVYSRSEGFGPGGSDHSEQVSRNALKTEGVFILDCNTEVYVWLGRKATSGIRLAGVQVAQRLVVMDELRPKWVELSQVQEGAEPFVFRTKFLDWFSINAQVTAKSMMASKHENLKNTGQLHAITAGQAARQRSELRLKLENRTEEDMKHEEVQREVRIKNSVNEMIVKSKTEAQDVSILDDVDKSLSEQLSRDDGCGMTIMWRLTNVALLQVDEVEHAHFRDNCIYVILYGFVAHSGDTDDEEERDEDMDEVEEQLAQLQEHDDPMVALSAAVKRRGLRLETGATMKQKGAPRFVLYVWCGERAPRTLLARWKMEVSTSWLEDWQEELGQTPKEIRIQQRLEPNHFLRVFSRSMVVHVEFAVKPTAKGRMLKDEAFSPTSPKSLFHIKGRPGGDENSLHAIQTRLTDDIQLNSCDVYLLHLFVPPPAVEVSEVEKEEVPPVKSAIIEEKNELTKEQDEKDDEAEAVEGETSPLGPVSKLWIWVGWRCTMEVREAASEIAARVSDYFDVESSQVNIAGETVPIYDRTLNKFVTAPAASRSFEEVSFWKDTGLAPPWPLEPEENKQEIVVASKPKKGIWRNLASQRNKSSSSAAQVTSTALPAPTPSSSSPPLDVAALPIPDMKELPSLYLRLTPNEEVFRDGGQAKQHVDGLQFKVDKLRVWSQHGLKKSWIILVSAPEKLYLWVGSEVQDAAGQVQDALKCSQAFLTYLFDETKKGEASGLEMEPNKTSDIEEAEMESKEMLNIAENSPSLSKVCVADKAVCVVRQYEEPPDFKQLLHGWCPWEQFDRETFLDPRAARLNGMKKSGVGLLMGRVVDKPAETTPETTPLPLAPSLSNQGPPTKAVKGSSPLASSTTTPPPISSTPIQSNAAITTPIPIQQGAQSKPAPPINKTSKKFIDLLRGRVRGSKSNGNAIHEERRASTGSSDSVIDSSMFTNSPLSPDEISELTSLLGRRTPLTNVETQRVQALMKKKSLPLPTSPLAEALPAPSSSSSLSIAELNELSSLMGRRTPLTNVETQRVQALMRQKTAYRKKVNASSSPPSTSSSSLSPVKTPTKSPTPLVKDSEQEPQETRRASAPAIITQGSRQRSGRNSRELSPPPLYRGRPADASVRAAAASARTVSPAPKPTKPTKKGTKAAPSGRDL